MKIFVNVKQIGKKRNSIEKKEYEISDDIQDIREFIADIVTTEVNEFNQKAEGLRVIDYMTDNEIEDKSAEGKISFNNDYNGKKQNLLMAIENAHKSYEDGIYLIFLNDNRLEDKLDIKLNLKQGDEFTFVRLAMLSGRMW